MFLLSNSLRFPNSVKRMPCVYSEALETFTWTCYSIEVDAVWTNLHVPQAQGKTKTLKPNKKRINVCGLRNLLWWPNALKLAFIYEKAQSNPQLMKILLRVGYSVFLYCLWGLPWEGSWDTAQIHWFLVSFEMSSGRGQPGCLNKSLGKVRVAQGISS